eukprot:Blabericola_migrator_1__418@NODE_10_length_25093_cov_104_131184_g7_i2_p13_GENE_NODE_10_length_25093_cov_104_131184_g7_i2NODE_10_length_25093_cov_104_131184_g7_i2_p13_ORF_typecomplete_len253_score11_12_NODE_10_length_25093_cov_104_131184_g7_i21179212550
MRKGRSLMLLSNIIDHNRSRLMREALHILQRTTGKSQWRQAQQPSHERRDDETMALLRTLRHEQLLLYSENLKLSQDITRMMSGGGMSEPARKYRAAVSIRDVILHSITTVKIDFVRRLWTQMMMGRTKTLERQCEAHRLVAVCDAVLKLAKRRNITLAFLRIIRTPPPRAPENKALPNRFTPNYPFQISNILHLPPTPPYRSQTRPMQRRAQVLRVLSDVKKGSEVTAAIEQGRRVSKATAKHWTDPMTEV